MNGLGTKAPPPVDWPWEADPRLYDFYAEALLEPGFEGPEPDLVTCQYIGWHLTYDARLRRQWRVRQALGLRRKKITPGIVRRLCRWWAEEILKTPSVASEVPFPAMREKRKASSPMPRSRRRREHVLV